MNIMGLMRNSCGVKFLCEAEFSQSQTSLCAQLGSGTLATENRQVFSIHVKKKRVCLLPAFSGNEDEVHFILTIIIR